MATTSADDGVDLDSKLTACTLAGLKLSGSFDTTTGEATATADATM